MEIKWVTSRKQQEALRYLEDKETTELFYGGAAGGGKSYTGCAWIILSCIRYPGTRYLIGRAHLKTLRESTLLTFFSVLKEWGFKRGEDFEYNASDHVVIFWNGSMVYLKDLFAYPSDPEFDSLGSTEYTAAFIDECSEVTLKAKNIVLSRLRYKLDEYGLIPKVFLSSNPSKNFLYFEFYKPYKNNTLPAHRKFVPALVTDNPFIDSHYIDNLQKLDKVSRERLLYGNFEYDDDPTKLMDYDVICNLFIGGETCENNKRYMSVDVARFGQDKTVICLWKGLHCYSIEKFPVTSVEDTKFLIKERSKRDGIPMSNIVIDEDGVGGGVVDGLPGVRGFINNSKPIVNYSQKKNMTGNFRNLKSQCYFYLAKLANEGKIKITAEGDDKEKIIEDLEQIKQVNQDAELTLAVTSKEEIKEKLGRSPDFGDAIMMRTLFELGYIEGVMGKFNRDIIKNGSPLAYVDKEKKVDVDEWYDKNIVKPKPLNMGTI